MTISPSFATLIEPDELMAHLTTTDWIVVDCRFSLADTEKGRLNYLDAHIPGAIYLHLDDDLSGPIHAGTTGRHPLPSVEALADLLAQKGMSETMQVVVYDDIGGGIAARLWWMLRWMGHKRAAVLNGGWPAWQEAGFPVRSDVERHPPTTYVPHLKPELQVDADFVDKIRSDQAYRLVDARAAARFKGEEEPIDPVAGHIPGAHSLPFAKNLDSQNRFLNPQQLAERFGVVLEGTPPDRVICYCGSGVTAAHNILAMEHAGLGMSRMYIGSWSEWITDPGRPIWKPSV